MKAIRRGSTVLAVLVLAAATSCAILPRKRLAGVPIEARPTPTPPPEEVAADTAAAGETPGEFKETVAAPRNTAVEAVMSADERRATLERIAADTTAASAAVGRCSDKTMLPDQESVYETTRSYLVQVRAALARNELWQAEQVARKARQLALALDCR